LRHVKVVSARRQRGDSSQCRAVREVFEARSACTMWSDALMSALGAGNGHQDTRTSISLHVSIMYVLTYVDITLRVRPLPRCRSIIPAFLVAFGQSQGKRRSSRSLHGARSRHRCRCFPDPPCTIRLVLSLRPRHSLPHAQSPSHKARWGFCGICKHSLQDAAYACDPSSAQVNCQAPA